MRALVSIVFLLALLLSVDAHAQDQPRYGVGFQVLGSTVEGNVGPGFRFRASAPLNQDVSLGLGTAFTGFIFEGRDDASFAFDPQASLIVTLPNTGSQSTYVLGGIGAYLPFGSTDADSAPTFHLGVGKVWLLNDSSFFAEFDPALYVGSDSTEVLLPIRVGVIF